MMCCIEKGHCHYLITTLENLGEEGYWRKMCKLHPSNFDCESSFVPIDVRKPRAFICI
jgi:hypothetical protein